MGGGETTHSGRRGALPAAALAWLAAGLASADRLGASLAPDGAIEHPTLRGAIAAGRVGLVALGVLLAWRGLPTRSGAARAAGLLALLLVAGAGAHGALRSAGLLGLNEGSRAVVREVIESENRLLELRATLGAARTDVLNLGFPGVAGRQLFAPEVEVADLDGSWDEARALPELGVVVRTARIEAAPRRVAREALALWRPLLERVERFEHGAFNISEGHFAGSPRAWEGKLTFAGRAVLRTGRLAQIEAEAKAHWDLDEAGVWRIGALHMRSLRVGEAAAPLFADVLDEALPDAGLRAEARRSRHEELVLASLLEPEFVPPHPHFAHASFDRHPGLAVCDIDEDGLPDLYVMEREGRNLLLRARGDGTFEDVAPRLGLDLDGFCSSALFVDLDNDGDRDLFVGRTLRRSAYFVNEGGAFVDRGAELVDGELPLLASSVCAADVDGDGLLDLYVSTYAYEMQAIERAAAGWGGPRTLLEGYLPRAEAVELARAWDDPASHPIRAAPGPRNVLLRNLGEGRLAVERDGPLGLMRNTYQSGFADVDGDGDPDLYCANDYAPNNLFRNDGPLGFVDVTEATGTADTGFGMGVSFGDYDEDGDPDLYVSNMFSKAGRRLTGSIPGVDGRLAAMARGNTLLRNDGAAFTVASGDAGDAAPVSRAGWSWGGQFLDVDLDGDLDLHALSGYYTAPREIEGPIDR